MPRATRWMLSGMLCLALVAVAAPACAAAKAPGPVDVNNASEAQLEGLPGLGLATATTPAPARTASATTTHAASGASSSQSTTVVQTPPAKGMVWVDTGTKVYHYEGDQWYGRTKEGKFMTEQDAIAAGYRPARKSGTRTGAPSNH